MGFIEVCSPSFFILDILLLFATIATGVAGGLALDKIRKKRKAAKQSGAKEDASGAN